MPRCEDPLRYAYGGQLTPTLTMALAAADVVQRLVNGGTMDGGMAAVLGAMAGTIGTMSAAALTVKVTRWQVRAQDTSALMQWRRQLGVRNGDHQLRKVTTSAGSVEVRVPRVTRRQRTWSSMSVTSAKTRSPAAAAAGERVSRVRNPWTIPASQRCLTGTFAAASRAA